ncbi:MAG: hypoxanthine/guanine phosphoribosyltransferase [Thermoplasmata archaeon]|nr:hypoxanthine/guanine phosphoribosyltransferase [Thermoplasmata archaeon]
MERLQKLKETLVRSPIIKKGDYSYVVHPATDGIPRMDKEILEEIIDELVRIGDFDKCDVIVTVEAIGIEYAAPLTLRTGKPFNIVRKRMYGLPGEFNLKQITGYSLGDLFVNDISKGDRVLIVDDVISTGGTIRAVIEGLRKIGAEVVDVLVVVEKGEGKELIEKELGIKIKTLVKIDVTESQVKIIG